jgi:formylglycine-generating enzyme
VPGGTYYRTYANAGSGPTGESNSASISGFRMDKYPVTVGRFRQFVNAWNSASWLPAEGSGKHAHLNDGQGLVDVGSGGGYESGWDAAGWNADIEPTSENLSCNNLSFATWTNTAGSRENLPINCMSWYEAYAFCIWDGGFLPSEAEWEYVAAGGSDQREYPWGSVAPGTACPGTGCEYAIYGCDYPDGSGSCMGGVINIAPVGYASQGAGRWGQLDMEGDVYELTLDWYAAYAPCTDCANLSGTPSMPPLYRVVRGDVFYFLGDSGLLPPNRADDAPTNRNGGNGFRCARTP